MGDTTLRELVYGKGAHVDPVACVEDISAELAHPHRRGLSPLDLADRGAHELLDGIRPAQGRGRESSVPRDGNRKLARASEPSGRAAMAGNARDASRVCWPNSLTLSQSDSATLERAVHNVGPAQSLRQSTVYAMLWGVAAHNSYHVGQIALLRRQLGAWPPRRGGDTW